MTRSPHRYGIDQLLLLTPADGQAETLPGSSMISQPDDLRRFSRNMRQAVAKQGRKLSNATIDFEELHNFDACNRCTLFSYKQTQVHGEDITTFVVNLRRAAGDEAIQVCSTKVAFVALF
jgi:hypothetical protein